VFVYGKIQNNNNNLSRRVNRVHPPTETTTDHHPYCTKSWYNARVHVIKYTHTHGNIISLMFNSRRPNTHRIYYYNNHIKTGNLYSAFIVFKIFFFNIFICIPRPFTLSITGYAYFNCVRLVYYSVSAVRSFPANAFRLIIQKFKTHLVHVYGVPIHTIHCGHCV